MSWRPRSNKSRWGCVVDGDLVVWSGERLDFDALQLRLVTARAALPALVRERPASFVAFDVLAVAGQDTRGLPFADRRALLEELARAWVPPLNLSPLTRDRAVAETWFREMPAMGLEGIIAKAGAQAYRPGRIWLKVKTRNVTDVVLAAVIGPMAQPRAVIVGLPVRGRLRIVGLSVPCRPGPAGSWPGICLRRRGSTRGRRRSANGFWTGLPRKAARST
jgi:ATP-dependent DNA ligase